MKSIQSLGIIGGNFTTAMICQEARLKGIKTSLLDPQIQNIARTFADEQLIAPYTKEMVHKLCLRCDKVIFGTAPVGEMVYEFAKEHKNLVQQEALKIMGHRLHELELADALEIPVPWHYTQKQDDFSQANTEHIEVPFKFYQFYADHYEMTEVFEEEDLDELMDGFDEKATSWLIEGYETYSKILSMTALKDEKGHIAIYEVQEEQLADENEKRIISPADISKTARTKLKRYTKKLLKAIDCVGLYTFKFGMRSNKSVVFLNMSPGMGLGDIGSKHYSLHSVYEQLIHILMDGSVYEHDPDGGQSYEVRITTHREIDHLVSKKKHLYLLDDQENTPIQICVQSLED